MIYYGLRIWLVYEYEGIVDTVVAEWTDQQAKLENGLALSADDLFNLPDDRGENYELIEGKLFIMSPAGFRHGRFVMRIAFAIESFVQTHQLGAVLAAETGFLLEDERGKETVLAPDVSFIRADRLPAQDAIGFGTIAPDLAVEVPSPRQTAAYMALKAQKYLDAGVEQVWVIFPDPLMAYIYDRNSTVKIILAQGAIDGGRILPGFTLPLQKISG